MQYYWHNEYLNFFLIFYLAIKYKHIVFWPYVSIPKKLQPSSSWLHVYP